MKKTVTLLIFFLTTTTAIRAQIIKEWGWLQIDTASIICQYTYAEPCFVGNISDTERMILEIGSRLSKFYSYDTFEYDSLQSTPNGRLIIKQRQQEAFRKSRKEKTPEGKLMALNSSVGRKAELNIYKNYPRKGEMFVQDAVGNEYYQYAEKDFLTSQCWNLGQDTLTILGYLCQNATCQWRGRTYQAWFTPEIPCSDGPHKFCGLPGLIMKVEDSDRIYSFEIQSIVKANGTGIYLTNDKVYKEGERKLILKKQVEYQRKIIRGINRSMQQIDSKKRVSDQRASVLEIDYEN